jgi:tRNA threonylcarbamoyladenosine biosynthesis protein TsaE
VRQWTATTASAEETRELGRILGELLTEPAALFLTGDLGAGKTCLTQGIARGLGVPEEDPVTSPSYTLMNHYRGRLDLFHFDLYRLSHPDDVIDLGFEEVLHGVGVAVVEWADRAAPPRDEGLFLHLLSLDEHIRTVSFEAQGARYERLLEHLENCWLPGRKTP